MAGYVLHLTEEENITVSGAVARRLIDAGSGDAALLYLCILRFRGSAEPEKLAAALHWEDARLHAAEAELARIGLVAAPERKEAPPAPPQPEELPVYTRADVAQKLEKDESFAALLREVERKLGPLSTPSLGKLLGLYEELGLGADVIYLLVNHCIARKQEQFGPGRLPTMREIEKEGYAWARQELFSTAAANEYLRRRQARRARFPEYMAVLQMPDRPCAPSEERYLSAWMEMGFPAETVAIAYDKTMLNCREFKWPYCNGILKRWHEKGLHTPEEVRQENGRKRAVKDGGKNGWMKEFV